ncbi:MAG: hypothetical protein JKY48_02515 [Flavobacteriales bacterium]|nr:hypothetical protein [Flavobacteriales bacterium]
MNYTQFISSWGNLFRTLVLLAALVGGIHLIIEEIAGDSSVALSFEGTEIRIGENGALKNHLVPSRGWTDSGIMVKKGDKIHITSTGSINISLGHMVEQLRNFTRIFRSKEIKDVDYFTAEEVDSSSFKFPWNDAMGMDLSKVHDTNALQRIKSVQSKLLDPKAKLGQLLIYNYTGDGYPLIEELTELNEVYAFEGNGYLIEIKGDGRIYFGVNDVVLFNHKMSELVWQDNVGFFSITTFTEYNN